MSNVYSNVQDNEFSDESIIDRRADRAWRCQEMPRPSLGRFVDFFFFLPLFQKIRNSRVVMEFEGGDGEIEGVEGKIEGGVGKIEGCEGI